MLLYPSINKLRDKTDSRYSLVILTSLLLRKKRAKDLSARQRKKSQQT